MTKELRRVGGSGPDILNAKLNRDRATEMFEAGMSAEDIAAEFPKVFFAEEGKLGQKYDLIYTGSGRMETRYTILPGAVAKAIARFKRRGSASDLLRGLPRGGPTGVESIGGGGLVMTGAAIPMFRFRVLIGGLKLEIETGMQMTRGRSAYSILKDELGLKGNKKKVYEQALAIFNRLYPVPTPEK